VREDAPLGMMVPSRARPPGPAATTTPWLSCTPAHTSVHRERGGSVRHARQYIMKGPTGCTLQVPLYLPWPDE